MDRNNDTNVNVISIKDNSKMICPFRNEIVVFNRMSSENIPEQVQTTYFPECYYGLCPYYDNRSVNKTEKCLRTLS